MARYDERDIMFARMEYKPGSKEYEDYYGRHPELKEQDDAMRAMPNILGEGTATYNPLMGPVSEAGFGMLGEMRKYVDNKPNAVKVETDPEDITRKIKNITQYFGAKLVGICKMEPEHYYSYRGRDGAYGETVDPQYPYGIVFAVEMDRDMINRAPQMEEMITVVKGYVDGAVAGMWLSYYIGELGYNARNNMDGSFTVIAPKVAEDAGLGEIGRNGLLITKKYGQRVRLGIVTTDLPLIPDSKEMFGVKELCQICGKCAQTCPGKAISKEDMVDIDGTKGWRIKQEDCYITWRRIGTDCGVCLSTCPLSQDIPESLVEDMKYSELARLKILEYYKEHYGIRPYIKKPLKIME